MTALARPEIRAIQQATARYFRVPLPHMLGERRIAKVVRARQVAVYLSGILTARSTTVLGRAFNRDHTTICHAIKVIDRLRHKDAEIQMALDALMQELQRDPAELDDQALAGAEARDMAMLAVDRLADAVKERIASAIEHDPLAALNQLATAFSSPAFPSDLKESAHELEPGAPGALRQPDSAALNPSSKPV